MDPRTEAKQLLSGIVQHQKNSDDKFQNIERQLSDLKTVQKKMVEADAATRQPVIGSDDYQLRSFIRKDGSLQMLTEKAFIDTPNGTRPIKKSGLLDSEESSCQWHEDLITLAGKRQMIRMMMETPYTPKMDLKLQKHMSKAPRSILPAVQKAFSDSAGEGQEWIPDQFLPDLFRIFEVPKRLRSVLETHEVDKAQVLIPRLNRGGRPYIKGKLTQDDPLSKYTASTVSTGQASIAIKGFATLYNIDDAAAEDSLIPLLSTLSRQIADDLEDAYEDCMINGDTAAAHADALALWDPRGRWGTTPALGGPSDHRRAFLGFRQASFDKATANAVATLSYSDFLTLRYNLGELGSRDCVCVVSPEVYLKYILDMDAVKTRDVYGDGAAVLTGEIAQIAGIPIVISRFLTNDLNATGLYTGAGATSGIIIFQKSSWYNYMRKGILVEQAKDIASGAIQLVSTMRGVMASPDPAAEKNVAYNYNLA